MEAQFRTTDLCDAHHASLQVVAAPLRHYGAKRTFYGQIATVKVFEDYQRVKDAVAEAGFHRVLVVDGGASLRCALLGDRLAALALRHHWAGIVINGAVRDTAALAALEIGVMALGHVPLRGAQRGDGTHNLPVAFGGVVFRPGEWLYADADGIVVSAARLT
ncbi:MAG: ribonuclease E activity regulator RraA [Burkholderiales bacterium]|nr:ribonuclease E activity regulator RraA [Burkholderiales bacterium]